MERRPHNQNRYPDQRRENSRRQGSSNWTESFDGEDRTSQKIRRMYLEEDSFESRPDRTMRRSRRQTTADLTWPDRATDVSVNYNDGRSTQDAFFDTRRTSLEDARRTSNTKRITYDSDNWMSYDPFDEDMDEGMSYHEERMARRAAREAQRSSSVARQQRSARERRAADTEKPVRRRSPSVGSTAPRRRPTSGNASKRSRSVSKKALESRSRFASAKKTAQQTRPVSNKTSVSQTRPVSAKTAAKRKRSGRTIDKKKLFLFAAAVLVVVAIIIAIIIIASKVNPAANLKLSTTDTTQTLSWDRKGKDLGYEVQQKSSDGSYQVVKTVSAEGATSVNIEGLTSATLYEYKVYALKGDEHPKRSAAVSIKGYTAPSVLTDITASTQIKESLTFVWSDTQPVAGFELRYGSAEDFSDATTITLTPENIVKDEGNGKNTYTLENQPEGTKYYYSMRSYCDQNSYSDWTPTATVRVTRPVDMHGIDVNAPMVAFTFDDGPDTSNITSRILDAFASVGGHATFFQLGQRAESYPEKIQRIVNEGHEIGNHTYDHAHLGDDVTSEDIIHANDAIEQAGGVRPVCFRSPGGETTELIRQTCIEENMALFYWSMDTRDWYTKNADDTISYIKSHIKDGDIILMHNIYDASAEAIEQILPWVVEQGYQLVTVSQLLVAKTGNLPEPGQEYSTATKTVNR